MVCGFELIDVYATVGTERVLRGVNVGAPRGQVTALVGPGGAGKTATFRILAGLDKPDLGAALVDGEDISRARGRQLKQLQRRLAVVFQGADDKHALFGDATVLDNVMFSMKTAGRVPRRRIESQARAELDRFALGDYVEAFPDDLTAVQRKGLALARGLALRAPFLLVDGLDAGLSSTAVPRAAGPLRQVLSDEAHRRGVTCLITTRSAGLARAVADQVVELRDGRCGGESDEDYDAWSSALMRK